MQQLVTSKESFKGCCSVSTFLYIYIGKWLLFPGSTMESPKTKRAGTLRVTFFAPPLESANLAEIHRTDNTKKTRLGCGIDNIFLQVKRLYDC